MPNSEKSMGHRRPYNIHIYNALKIQNVKERFL